jgi:hypothetical protein
LSLCICIYINNFNVSFFFFLKKTSLWKNTTPTLQKDTTLLLQQAQLFFYPLKGEGSVVKSTKVLSLWTISGSLCSDTATAANDHFVGTSWNLWSATLHEDRFCFCSLIRPQWSVKCELIWTGGSGFSDSSFV